MPPDGTGQKGKGRGGRGKKTRASSSSPFALSPPPAPPPAPTVAVVGAGRLGTALARALADAGYEVVAVVARRAGHAERASSLTGTRPRALSAARLELLPATHLLFLTTPDDALAEVAARLAAQPCDWKAQPGGGRVRRRVALHASGALSSGVLAPLRARGFAVGSMHPLVAVSDAVAGAESLRTAFYCVEGDRPAVAAARRVVRALGGRSFTLGARDKALYHAAAVMTAGHAVALFDLAARVLSRCGLSERRAREVLTPLLRSTTENLSAQSPARALTGTFARADVATVRRHLEALGAAGPDAALEVYALLGRLSLRLAEEGGADRSALGEIAAALDKEGKRPKAKGRSEAKGKGRRR